MRALAIVVALVCVPMTARAQQGELQFGIQGSYGAAESVRSGGALVAGLAAGRVSYVGLRWSWQSGSTQPVAASSGAARTSLQVFAFDVGLMIPLGAFEIVPGCAIAAARFTQKTVNAAQPGETHDAELLIAPGLAVQARVAGLLLVPEIQYYLGSSPELPWPARHRGPVASLRLVVPIELSRIRH